MSDLQLLYQLQQLELQLEAEKQKLKNLPVIAEFALLKAESADAKESLAWTKTKFIEQKKRIKRLETDLLQTETEQQEAQDELYGDHDQSVKELEQLDRRVESLNKERIEKEEMLLMSMEGKDELEKALLKAKAANDILHTKLLTMQKEGNAEIRNIKAAIQKIQKQCQQLRAQIDKKLLAEYQQLRTRYNGKPIACVENDTCSGCRVQVYIILKQKLKEPGAKVYCENCGRLLVPAL